MKNEYVEVETGKAEQIGWEVLQRLLNGTCPKLQTEKDFLSAHACKYLRDYLIENKKQLFWAVCIDTGYPMYRANAFVAIGSRTLMTGAKKERIGARVNGMYLILAERSKVQLKSDKRLARSSKGTLSTL